MVASQIAMDGGDMLEPRMNQEAPEPRFRLGGFQRVSHYTLWSWGAGAGIAPVDPQLLTSYTLQYNIYIYYSNKLLQPHPKYFSINSRSNCGYTGNRSSSCLTRALASSRTVGSTWYLALLGFPALAPVAMISG